MYLDIHIDLFHGEYSEKVLDLNRRIQKKHGDAKVEVHVRTMTEGPAFSQMTKSWQFGLGCERVSPLFVVRSRIKKRSIRRRAMHVQELWFAQGKKWPTVAHPAQNSIFLNSCAVFSSQVQSRIALRDTWSRH